LSYPLRGVHTTKQSPVTIYQTYSGDHFSRILGIVNGAGILIRSDYRQSNHNAPALKDLLV